MDIDKNIIRITEGIELLEYIKNFIESKCSIPYEIRLVSYKYADIVFQNEESANFFLYCWNKHKKIIKELNKLILPTDESMETEKELKKEEE